MSKNKEQKPEQVESGDNTQGVPQRPMSIENYIKALQKEYEVAKLRSGIAECMFKERMAMVQMKQLEMNMSQPSVQQSEPTPLSSLTEQEQEKVEATETY